MEERITHWKKVLETTPIPPELASPVAQILAQDERLGFTARTPGQQSIMGKAAQAISEVAR